MDVLESDLGVYVVSGGVALLVYIVAIAVLITQTSAGLTTSSVPTFTVGFLLFLGVYFTAMAVYRGVQRGEPE
ncbi:MAG: hypothetical protein ACI8UR_001160 [Natronomonas sp.]|jgi:hypothetical protein|uniref:hypothetical protein n=1 Tax=Natronomonas sp. TaxID=2184060 RepID=UPI00398989F3